MSYVIALVLIVGVVLIVSSPWRRPASAATDADGAPAHEHSLLVEGESSPERLELEAARDAKFREIRDAELDHQTGKLSEDDFGAIDSTLRAEAMDLLRKLDTLDEQEGAEPVGGGGEYVDAGDD